MSRKNHMTRVRTRMASMMCVLALCLAGLCSVAAPPAQAASARDVSTCFGAYSMAGTYSEQMVQLPSHTQRLISAVAAARTWTQAAALCPAAVFPYATAQSSLAAYRAQILARGTSFDPIDTASLLGYMDDSHALLTAIRETCGYDAAQTANDSGSALHTGVTGVDGAADVQNDKREKCVSTPQETTGLSAEELGAVALAEDRAGYIATTLYARLKDEQYNVAAQQLTGRGADFAGMLQVIGCSDTRLGTYSSSILRTLDGQAVTDPLTGLAMSILTVANYDAAAESLAEMSRAIQENNSENSTDTQSKYVTFTEHDLTGSSDGYVSTDPTVSLSTSLARRRAVSTIIASQLLNAYNAGAPAILDFLM